MDGWKWVGAALVLVATVNAMVAVHRVGRFWADDDALEDGRAARDVAHLLRSGGWFQLAVAASLVSLSPADAWVGAPGLVMVGLGMLAWGEVKRPTRLGRWIGRRLLAHAHRRAGSPARVNLHKRGDRS